MRLNWIALSFALSAITIPGASLAQQPPQNFYHAPSNFAGKTVVLPIGTTFEGRIQSTIGSSASHSGESFKVEVSAPVMANGSEVIIPSGSEVIGEVAEAIRSGSQPHDKGTLAKLGILRVQLTAIRFPDGQSYPMVASFAPDGTRGRSQGVSAARKSTVAYVGTQAGFDAVNPALHPKTRNNQGRMEVMRQSEVMGDPIFGDTGSRNNGSAGQIRALIRKGRDLYIMSGSSLTIRLDSPLKIALGGSSTQSTMQGGGGQDEAPSMPSGKHFAKTRSNQPAADDQGMQQAGAPQQGGYPPQGYQQQGGQPQSVPPGYNQQPGQQAPVEQPGSSF